MRILFLFTAIMLSAIITFSQDKSIQEVLVEGGTFRMGNDYSNKPDERPVHKVTVSSFYMAKYEVTVEQYTKFTKVIGEKPPRGDYNTPIQNVSWKNSVMYCNWLSSKSGLENYYGVSRDSVGKVRVSINPSANGYRLPTEAEWEYAAKGGNKSKFTAYSGGNIATEVAWFKQNAGNRVHEIGLLKANELGIYDMSGNVSEWCYDWYTSDYYSKSKDSTNPKGPVAGIGRVCRGGDYGIVVDALRNTKRFILRNSTTDAHVGIRIVRNAD